MTFTIDTDNNITAHATPEEAAAATTTPFDTFSSQKELAELAKAWPAERLVAIFSCLTGVTPVESFKSSKTAVGRIWQRIQGLGAPEEPKPEQAPKPKAKKNAKGGAQSADGASAKGKLSKKATPAKKAPKAAKKAAKAKNVAKAKDAAAPREGSKTAQVIAMLQRKNGSTISEIMDKMGWQKHTVRGFMAGAMKKAGYTVESFKPEGGERSYRLPK
ncbi:MAG: DUF3489 domain-containing protein [Bryobacteraceae bacterium]|jgi:hypothetical protein